jgi:hypothetical protein
MQQLTIIILALLAAGGSSADGASSTRRRRLQPSAAACCFAGGHVEYVRMPDCQLGSPPPQPHHQVFRWPDFLRCWEAMRAHYSNTTRQDPGGINATIAETNPVFVITLAPGAALTMPTSAPTLTLDAAALHGAVPVNEMVPFEVVVSFPFPDGGTSAQPCPEARLSQLRLELTDHAHAAGHPLALSFSGCGRHASRLEGLSLRALGWGNPDFGFLGMSNATLLTLAPPQFADADEAQGSIEAVSWIESDVNDSTVAYFGDVSANFGDSVGLGATQNGSRALRTTFSVVDPSTAWGAPYRLRRPGVDSNYQFEWCHLRTH